MAERHGRAFRHVVVHELDESHGTPATLRPSSLFMHASSCLMVFRIAEAGKLIVSPLVYAGAPFVARGEELPPAADPRYALMLARELGSGMARRARRRHGSSARDIRASPPHNSHVLMFSRARLVMAPNRLQQARQAGEGARKQAAPRPSEMPQRRASVSRALFRRRVFAASAAVNPANGYMKGGSGVCAVPEVSAHRDTPVLRHIAARQHHARFVSVNVTVVILKDARRDGSRLSSTLTIGMMPTVCPGAIRRHQSLPHGSSVRSSRRGHRVS